MSTSVRSTPRKSKDKMAETMDAEQESRRDDGRLSTRNHTSITEEQASSPHDHFPPSLMATTKEEPLSNPKGNFPGTKFSTRRRLSLYEPDEEPHSFQGDHIPATAKRELTSLLIKEERQSDKGHNLSDANQPSLDRQISYKEEDLLCVHTSQIKVEPFSSDPVHVKCPPAKIKEEHDGENPTNMDISTPPDHSLCLPIKFKEEEEDFPHSGVHMLEGAIVDFECIKIKLKTKPMQDKAASTSQPSQSPKSTYACPVCKRSFSNYSNVVRHRATHNGKKMSCLECGADFCNKHDLKMHARIHKAKRAPYGSKCNITFRSNSHHIIHERIHTGEKPFTYFEIGENPKIKEESNGSLTHTDNFIHHTHAFPHIEAQPFPQADDAIKDRPRCPSFHIKEETSSYDISFHQMTSDINAELHLYELKGPTDKNTFVEVKEEPGGKEDLADEATPYLGTALYNGDEKLLSCSFCNKLFLHKSHLLIHQKEHSGLRPFSCHYC